MPPIKLLKGVARSALVATAIMVTIPAANASPFSFLFSANGMGYAFPKFGGFSFFGTYNTPSGGNGFVFGVKSFSGLTTGIYIGFGRPFSRFAT